MQTTKHVCSSTSTMVILLFHPNVPPTPPSLSHFNCSSSAAGFGCKMRTLDSGIGTIPLPESCSFFSSILHLLPKSSSTPEQSLSPPSVPGSSSEEVSPSPLPRWRIPSGFKDGSRHAGVPNSLSDSSMTHVQSVPFPTVAFLQPLQPQSEFIMPPASVCDTQSRIPRSPQGTVAPTIGTMSATEGKGILILFSVFGTSEGSLIQLLKEVSNDTLTFTFLFKG